MILKDKITVAIRQDNPERNIFKTIYLTRQLHYDVDSKIEWIKWRGYKWAVQQALGIHCNPISDVYTIIYCMN